MNRLAVPRIFAVAALALASLPASAQEKRFGAWTVGVLPGKDGVYAATVNDSGGLLGQYCYTKDSNCVWLLANDVDCAPNNRYPVLVNADNGAASLEILCMKLEGRPRYAFTDFDAIDAIVRKGTRVGIAFPMVNGLFLVNRFSLEGSLSAVTFMREMAEALAKKVGAGTRDQTF